jgi:hypothetical protein
MDKNIFGFTIRHYWDSQEKKEKPWSIEFFTFKFGIEFKKIKKYKINKKNKILNCYIIGINLLVINIKFFIITPKLC